MHQDYGFLHVTPSIARAHSLACINSFGHVLISHPAEINDRPFSYSWVHPVLDAYVLDKHRLGPGSAYKLRYLLDRLSLKGQPWTLCDTLDVGKRKGARAFLHVDLTNDPPVSSELTNKYEKVINGRAQCLDRRLYSTARVLAGEACNGPVIVKSIFNHRGGPELRYAEAHDFYPSYAGLY